MKPKMNIIMLGDGEVGKTSILKFFDKRKTNTSQIRTTGLDQITIVKKIDDNEFKVIFWDTAGQEK
jgi:small GTP-binding protein